jgi:hypothetical protein
VPPSCRLISRVVPVLVPRAGPAAQALSRSCLVPALALWCRARAVLFWAVPVLAHRAWPIWPSIPPRSTDTTSPRASHDTTGHRHAIASVARPSGVPPRVEFMDAFHRSSAWPGQRRSRRGKARAAPRGASSAAESRIVLNFDVKCGFLRVQPRLRREQVVLPCWAATRRRAYMQIDLFHALCASLGGMQPIELLFYMPRIMSDLVVIAIFCVINPRFRAILFCIFLFFP